MPGMLLLEQYPSVHWRNVGYQTSANSNQSSQWPTTVSKHSSTSHSSSKSLVSSQANHYSTAIAIHTHPSNPAHQLTLEHSLDHSSLQHYPSSDTLAPYHES